ncbi:MAG: GtrA family protein [Burkholderiaceae bacterium]
MISHFLTRQFVNFLFVGGLAALLHWLARIALSQWMPFQVAVLLAYGIGMGVAFVLNSLFVFAGSSKPRAAQARDFVMTNLAFLPVVWIVSIGLEWLFRRWLPVPRAEAFAHAVAVAVPTFATFLIYKFFAFKDQKHG